MNGRPLIAIAVDFGTTYTGVAYQPVDNARAARDQAFQIGNWPRPRKDQNKNSFKVPSKVCYDRRTGAYAGFGYNAESMSSNNVDIMKWFKLIAFPQDNPVAHTTSNSQLRRPEPRTPEQAVVDFLTAVHEHVVAQLEIRALEPSKVDYDVLFTVPASYNLRNAEQFRKIVMKTPWNAHKISVGLKEPEAAARYTIDNVPGGTFERGTCFILCDAGGGTVDLASFFIRDVQPDYALDQVDIVNGRRCGSQSIDKNFKGYFLQCVPQAQCDTIQEAEFAATMESFTTTKEAFDDDRYTPIWDVQVYPGHLTGMNVSNGRMRLSPEDMRRFFQFSVDSTLELLDGHVASCRRQKNSLGPLKSIFLVGGLGSSNYLLQRVKAQFEPLGINVYQPGDADYAVVMGAISTHVDKLRKARYPDTPITDPFRARICPYNFGVLCSSLWDPLKHDKTLDSPYLDPITGDMLADNQVLWLIKKGEKFKGEEAEKSNGFHRTFKEKIKALPLWESSIVTSDLDVPPARFNDPNVQVLLKLESDLRKAGANNFEVKKQGQAHWYRRRKRYNQCDFVVEMKLGQTQVEFAIVYKDKQRRGSEALNVNWI